MAKPVRVRKLDCPPDLRHGTADLAVDEVPESPDPHEERRRNAESVGKEEERLPVPACKESRANRATEHKPVRSHAPEPVGGNLPKMLTVERPFVECDLDGSAADEDADGHAAVCFEPGGHDLHAGRIDAGEEDAGEKAQQKRRVNAIDKESDTTIGQSTQKSANSKEVAGVEDVGEI